MTFTQFSLSCVAILVLYHAYIKGMLLTEIVFSDGTYEIGMSQQTFFWVSIAAFTILYAIIAFIAIMLFPFFSYLIGEFLNMNGRSDAGIVFITMIWPVSFGLSYGSFLLLVPATFALAQKILRILF